MKKLMIACACLLALGMMSCKDTNYCYELTAKNDAGKSVSTYYWGTQNDLDAYKDILVKEWGIDKKAIKYKKTNKAQSDCFGASIKI